VKSDDLVANQVLPGGEPSGNSGSPLVTVGDQLRRGPLTVRISAFIDLEPFTPRCLERGAISIARGHKSRDGAQVIAGPVGPLESHVASSVDVEHFTRSVITAFVAGNAGARDVRHGAIARDLTNDPNRHGIQVRVGERRPSSLGLPIGNDISDISVGGYGGDSSKQDNKTVHG